MCGEDYLEKMHTYIKCFLDLYSFSLLCMHFLEDRDVENLDTWMQRGTKQNLVEGEDALLHQRRLFGEGTSQRNSASEVVCGTRARTTQELEQRQSAEPHTSALRSSNPPQQSVKEVCQNEYQLA